MAQIEEVLGLVDAYGYAKKWGFELSRDDFGRVMANLPQTLIEATEMAEKATAAAAPLSITKEPPLNVNVTSGGEVNLTLEATGHELTYVWQKKAAASGGAWEPVRTSDQPEYSFYFSDTTPALYRCVIIDDFGRMMKSSVTTVTVVQAGDEGIVENPVVDEATYYQMQEILDVVKELAERSESADTSASDAALAAQAARDTAVSASTSAQDAASSATASETSAAQSATSASQSADSAAQSAREAAETLEELTTDTTLTESGTPADAKATGDGINSLNQRLTNQIRELKRDFAGIPLEVTGEIVTLTDSAGAVQPRSLVLNLTPHQEGSGDPSPDNVRPITGVTGVTVTRAGKNLIGIKREGWSAQGEITNADNAVRSDLIRVPSGATVYTSKKEAFDNSGYNLVCRCFDADKNFIQTVTALSYNVLSNRRTFPKGAAYVGFVQFLDGAKTDAEIDAYELYVSLIDDQYAPYTAQTYPITFPSEAGTVYGGTLNPLTGELTVDRAMKTFNGSEAWNFYQFSTQTGQYRAYISIDDIDTSVADSVIAPWLLSNMYNTIKYSNGSTETGVATRYGISQVNVFQSEYKTVESLKAFLAENNLQIAYKLATPITYQLTPAQVELLKGSNTLWIDADGTIDLTYNGDIKTYIDSKVAELQALILENNG